MTKPISFPLESEHPLGKEGVFQGSAGCALGGCILWPGHWPVLGASFFVFVFFHKAQTQRETLGNEPWEVFCPPSTSERTFCQRPVMAQISNVGAPASVPRSGAPLCREVSPGLSTGGWVRSWTWAITSPRDQSQSPPPVTSLDQSFRVSWTQNHFMEKKLSMKRFEKHCLETNSTI